MVTAVFIDSTNVGTKKPKQRSHSQPAKERQTSSRLLFAPEPQTYPPLNMLSRPKALTASLLIFDGKSEKFETFGDLFRNYIKIYHLTEIRKNSIHSLLRRDSLQAHCNLEEFENGQLGEIVMAFRRHFANFQSSAKSKCVLDALHFDP